MPVSASQAGPCQAECLPQTEPVLEEWPEATTTQTEEDYIAPIREAPPKPSAEIATQVDDVELRPPTLASMATATQSSAQVGHVDAQVSL